MGSLRKRAAKGDEGTEAKRPGSNPSGVEAPGSKDDAVEIRYEPTVSGDSDMTSDLMRLIGQAIDVWARRHGLSNMPPDIIFEQALLALNEIQRLASQQAKQRQK